MIGVDVVGGMGCARAWSKQHLCDADKSRCVREGVAMQL